MLRLDASKCKSIDEIGQDTPASTALRTRFLRRLASRISFLKQDLYQNVFQNISLLRGFLVCLNPQII